MALVKPLNMGRGLVPSYHTITGLHCVIKSYMHREAREETDEPIVSFPIDLIAAGIITKEQVYELLKKHPDFADAVNETSIAPVREETPEMKAE